MHTTQKLMTIQSFLMQGASVRTPAHFSLTAVALAVTLAQAAFAHEQKHEEVVVTATRTQTKIEETLADITVITREQIQEMAPGRTVVEVLQRLAGIQINSQGGRGQSQSVFIRGSESRHTLLMIDGARHGSATQGTPSFANIPLELIDRIEVVKGPASALYGSEAVGGVIQIFTTKGRGVEQPLVVSSSATVGKNGHKSADLRLSGTHSGFDYQLGLARVLDHGFSAQKVTGTNLGSDDDGFRQTSANFGLGYQFNQDWRIEASTLHTKGRAEFDDYDPNYSPYVLMSTEVSRLALEGIIREKWRSILSLSESIDRQENLGGSWNSFAKTKQTEIKWDQNIKTNLGKILFGLERLEQKIDDRTPVATPTSRNINAALLGLTGEQGKHSWQLSTRHDDNSQFGGHTTYGVNYGYEIMSGLRAYASTGTSMRAPSFQDLYANQGGRGWDGNPLLTPETGKSNEFGLLFNKGAHRAKWLRYDNKVTNLISQGQNGVAYKMNLPGITRMRGWTAEYVFSSNSLDFSTSYDWLKARQADGSQLIGRATSQVRIGLDKSIEAWKLGASAIRVGERKDYSGKILPAYATLDISARYQINSAMALQLRIANATNRQYSIADGYNTLGRAAYISVQWTSK